MRPYSSPPSIARRLLSERVFGIFPESLEAAFWQARHSADRRTAQIVSSLGIVGLLAFGLLDVRASIGPMIMTVILLRTALGAGMGMALMMASNRTEAPRVLRALGLMLIGGTGALLCMENAVFWSQDVAAAGYSPLVLTVALYSAPAAHLRHILPVAMSIVLLQAIALFSFDSPSYYPLLSLVFVNILLSVLIYHSERIERRAFLQRCVLQEERKSLARMAKEYQRLAEHDALTGLFNRRAFYSRLENIWSEASIRGAPVALMVVDIDHFKKYNDTYGHQQGDFALQQVSRALCAVVRPEHDLLARHGGEEFVLAWPGLSDEDVARRTREMMRRIRMLNLEHRASTTAPYLTLSGGLAICHPDEGETIEIAFCRADEALYAAKDAGRNRTRWAPAPAARQAG
ncbi:MAG: GGDEF domain-containing protein [Myxococcota bacterium]